MAQFQFTLNTQQTYPNIGTIKAGTSLTINIVGNYGSIDSLFTNPKFNEQVIRAMKNNNYVLPENSNFYHSRGIWDIKPI